MSVTCPCCKKHNSRRTRACISCRLMALPSCRPERCMIVAGLTSRTGLNPNRSIQSRFVRREQGSWTLCKFCMQMHLTYTLTARATKSGFFKPCGDQRLVTKTWNEYCVIASIISHYCGGPWNEDLFLFYSELYHDFRWYSPEGEQPQLELKRPSGVSWRLRPEATTRRR